MDVPTVEPEKRGARRRRRSGRGRSRLRRWLWPLAVVIVVIGLLPLGLTVLYTWPPVHPVSTLMVKDLVMLRGYDRRWRPLEEISPHLVNSVVMSEDGQFCGHRGIDLGEMRAIIADALAGEATRGGSTITMQTAKNLFLWQGRSYLRKAIELPLAVYIDGVMHKKRIMEIYLNMVEWGPGIYGAEAAARHHFGIGSADLSRRQAALLAVTLPNPITRDPASPTSGLNRLAGIIERRAQGAGGYVACLQ